MVLIYFNLWKTKMSVEKQWDNRELKLVKMNRDPIPTQIYYSPESEDSWYEIFWEKNKARLLSQHVISDKKRSVYEEHLYVERKRIEREMKRYWKFKSQKALKMIFLHLRRKLRYILAFSFMRYRINVLLISKQKQKSKQKPRFLMLKD
jgi:hypothetical protein